MKQLIAFTVLLVIGVVLVVPALVVRGLGMFESPSAMKTNHVEKNIGIRVYLHEQNKIVEMNLEDYVKGVVAAEMPAEFEMEALKAQAVAARTYAVKNMTMFGGSGLAGNPGADVSSDYKTSQAWLNASALKERWGEAKFEQYWQKISQAVEASRGMVATYQGEPINAVFHSTSGARTASAKEVWGFDYPYLQSVPCSWDQKSPRYTDSKEFTLAELEKRLGSEAGVVAAVQNGNTAVTQILDRTESGRVDKIRIGSKNFTGQEIRDKLELRSTNFTAEASNDKMVFKTEGNGHGVGLCQYGANGLAKEGRDFRQILTYYYIGVGLRNIYDEH